MPHVQVRGARPLAELQAGLRHQVEQDPPQVLKLREAFLAREGREMILEAIVVEGYLRQSFLVLVRADAHALVVRCHPFSHPQKTEGVKRLIAHVGRLCRDHSPGAAFGNTNLGAYLE